MKTKKRKIRLDAVAYDASEATSSIRKTPEGYLHVRGHCMKPGVSAYWIPQTGKIERRLRLPEEVFDKASLDSYAHKPVTDEHPCLLDASNTRYYSRGNVGVATKSKEYVASDLMITDAELIKKIEKQGAVQLSPAYKFRREEKPGIYNGEPYDVVCRNIRTNHVAVTMAGRQGSDIALIMDSDDVKKVPGLSFQVSKEQQEQLSQDSKDKRAHTVKIKLAGKTVEVDDAVAEGIETERKDAKDTAEKLTSSLDTAEKALEKSTKELKEATDEKKFLARVNARVSLVENARKVLGSKLSFDSLSDVEIMTKALERAKPELKLEGRDEAFIAAAFELAMDSAEDKKKVEKKKAKAAPQDDEDEDDDSQDSDEEDEEYDEDEEDDSQDSDEDIDENVLRAKYVKKVSNPKNHYQKPPLS